MNLILRRIPRILTRGMNILCILLRRKPRILVRGASLRLFLVSVFGLLFFNAVLAETIKLKSGQEVEGAIIERTEESIDIVFMGVPITYFLDEIESIDGVLVQTPEEEGLSESLMSAEDYFFQGVEEAKEGNVDKAILDFSRAIDLNPDLAEAYYNRGLGFFKKDDFEQAISDFSMAIEIKPEYKEAYNNRAVAYFKHKEYEKAWIDMQKAVELGYNVSLEFIGQLKRAREKKN